MEVHAHSHTARKKWTHYFWEFLMLFLAVFCGFLAENIREHKVEKEREKQFMKSLLYDLRMDSVFLSGNLGPGPRIVRYDDSLLSELQKRPLQGREKRIYHFLSLISEGVGFRYYDRTVSQLRYSGGFRLISNPGISNAVLDYDVLMREGLGYSTSVESWGFVTPAIQKSAAVFDMDLVFRIYEDARKYINCTDSIHFPPGLKLITYNDREIKEFVNLQRFAQITDEVKLDYSKRAFEKTGCLIHL